MPVDPDDVARCVLLTFDSLPASRRPRVRDGATREWVPLSGIVLIKDDGTLKCVSLGTGMKCLPASEVPKAQGAVLHDCHAEVIAIRAFNRFLIGECASMVTRALSTSAFVRRRDGAEITSADYQPFTLRDDVKIAIYSSEAPCGDASMELIMNAQDDPTPWADPAVPTDGTTQEAALLHGRGYFSRLGAVRRKPARADAPVTLSKSCSDKLCLHQCTSLLKSATSLLIHPSRAYIHTFVVPKSQYVSTAFTRALEPAGRLSSLPSRTTTSWQNGYALRAFRTKTTSLEFPHSRRQAGDGRKLVASNICAVYTPQIQETLIGGVVEGRKRFDVRNPSAISRRGLWRAAAELATLVAVPGVVETLRSASYGGVKSSELLRARRAVKHDVREAALTGWLQNSGDEDFNVEI